MSVKVRISSVNGSAEVEVPEGSTLDVALAEANIPADAGLEAKVNGQSVSDPASTPVSAGDQVVATPRDVKLGL